MGVIGETTDEHGGELTCKSLNVDVSRWRAGRWMCSVDDGEHEDMGVGCDGKE